MLTIIFHIINNRYNIKTLKGTTQETLTHLGINIVLFDECWDALCAEHGMCLRGTEYPLHLALPVVQSFGHLLILLPKLEGTCVVPEGAECFNVEVVPILLDDLLGLQHSCNSARGKVNSCEGTKHSER